MKKKFSWQRKRLVFTLFLVSATLFLMYQLIFMFLLGNSETKSIPENLNSVFQKNISKPSILEKDIANILDNKGMIRGIKLSDLRKYRPNENGMFMCFESKTEIEYSMVNDDYCDCPEDGSDEPGTNACNNGVFYCSHQPRNVKSKPLSIPSSRVNDGVCDCCDGSDEWNSLPMLDQLPIELQRKLGRYQAPCTNYCLHHL